MKRIIIMCLEFLCACVVFYKVIERVKKNKDVQIERSRQTTAQVEQLLCRYEGNKALSDSPIMRAIKSVAIYGNGKTGKHLIRELRSEGYEVKGIIDKVSCVSTFMDIDIYRPYEPLPVVDLVLVTPLNDYEEIKKELSKCVSCPIIKYTDILEF